MKPTANHQSTHDDPQCGSPSTSESIVNAQQKFSHSQDAQDTLPSVSGSVHPCAPLSSFVKPHAPRTKEQHIAHPYQQECPRAMKGAVDRLAETVRARLTGMQCLHRPSNNAPRKRMERSFSSPLSEPNESHQRSHREARWIFSVRECCCREW